MVVPSRQTAPENGMGTEPHLSFKRLATGLLAVAMTVVALVIAFQLQHRYPFEPDFHAKIGSPVLALELSTDTNDLKEVLHTENPGQANPESTVGKALASLRSNTYEDFLFIPLYTSFLWAFAILFAGGPDLRHIVYTKAMTGVVILVAASDGAENVGILRALHASSIGHSIAQAICWPSRLKWGLFAVALLLTGRILVHSSSPVYSVPTRRLLGLAYGAAGILMLIGLRKPHVIELATSLFALLTVINTIGLLGPYIERVFFRARSPVYVDDFCNRKARMQADVAVYQGGLDEIVLPRT